MGLPSIHRPPPDQKRKAGELPFKRIILEAPLGYVHPSRHKETQAGLFKQAQEADQAQKDRGTPPSEDGDPKIAKGQPHPSREVVPVTGAYHESRGRDFSKITGGDDQHGLTIQEQGRRQVASENTAEWQRQKFLPKPVR